LRPPGVACSQVRAAWRNESVAQLVEQRTFNARVPRSSRGRLMGWGAVGAVGAVGRGRPGGGVLPCGGELLPCGGEGGEDEVEDVEGEEDCAVASAGGEACGGDGDGEGAEGEEEDGVDAEEGGGKECAFEEGCEGFGLPGRSEAREDGGEGCEQEEVEGRVAVAVGEGGVGVSVGGFEGDESEEGEEACGCEERDGEERFGGTGVLSGECGEALQGGPGGETGGGEAEDEVEEAIGGEWGEDFSAAGGGWGFAEDGGECEEGEGEEESGAGEVDATGEADDEECEGCWDEEQPGGGPGRCGLGGAALQERHGGEEGEGCDGGGEGGGECEFGSAGDGGEEDDGDCREGVGERGEAWAEGVEGEAGDDVEDEQGGEEEGDGLCGVGHAGGSVARGSGTMGWVRNG
jgi:hypothetical protein